MDRIFGWWLGLTIVALIWREPIRNSFRKLTPGVFANLGRLAYRLLFAFPVWIFAFIFSTAILHKIFPNESMYIMAGSWIVLVPATVWALIVIWVIFAGIGGTTNGGNLDSIDGRIDAFISAIGKLLGSFAKYAAWVVGAIVAVGALFLAGYWINERIAAMPTSEAIISGAIIIALAVAVTGSRRA